MSALRRLAVWGVVSLCVLVGGLVFGSVGALAGATHEYLSQVTEVPAKGPAPAEEPVALPGPFGAVHALTVDGGGLYVGDDDGEGSNYRLDVFGESSGSFVSQFAQVPSLSYLHDGVAVGHSSGETQVYVGGDQAGSHEGAVAVFGAAGGLLNVWTGADTPSGSFGCFECNRGDGVAVDASASLGDWAAGDVYVADPFHGVVDVFVAKAEGKEEYLTRLEGPEPEAGVFFTKPLGVAVDEANGDVVVQDEHVVDIFEPVSGVPGAYKFLFDITGTPARSFNELELEGMAVDGGSGEIYVSTSEGGGVLDQFSASGVYLGQLTGTPAGSFQGVGPVAVDPGTHRLFVADLRGGALSGVVDVFGADLTVPDAVTQAASGVHPVSVTLNGTVNPDGVSLSDCHFDYGPTASYGQSVPCEQSPGTIGSGSAPVAVSANLAGLAAGAVYHFRLVASNANSINGPSLGQDQVFGAPQIAGESASGETKTTATLTAQVNPDGVDTTYRFEYGPTSAYGTSVPVPDGDIGAGASDVPLNTELTGLTAGATYHYRIIATNASSTTSGEDETFTTVAPALIDSVTITNVTPTGATVHAQIDPLGTDTTYRIEYGASTSYGTSIPVPDGDIGSGSGDQPVTQQLGGLTMNTTYHVRVVAQNAFGTITGSDHTFVYDTSGGGLPDNRSYELVTPAHKNGALFGDVLFEPAPEVSADGRRVATYAIQCFADAKSCYAYRGAVGTTFMFTRAGGGWQASALAPPATQTNGITAGGYNADAGTALFFRPSPPAGQDDFYGRKPDGSFVDLGPMTPPSAGAHLGQDTSQALLGDLSHLVWQSGDPWPFDPTAGTHQEQLYEYVGVGGKQPLLVGVSGGPGSMDLISSCKTMLASDSSAPGRMSVDGGTVFFTAQACASGTGVNVGVSVPADALYARIDESRTVAISARAGEAECDAACQASPAGDARFEGASDDGSRAFFVSTQQLLDAASEDHHAGDSARGTLGCASTVGVNGCNLYEYDAARPVGQRLVDVSAGDSSGGGPRVRGVVAISADGSHVYFVAGGVLTAAANAQGQFAQGGADNLYVFERDASHPEGRVSFIAALNASDHLEWDKNIFGVPTASVTPDGRFLVFRSSGRLTADDTSVGGALQVFRYDALTGQLLRISVGNDGFDDNGNRSTGTPCGLYGCREDARIPFPSMSVGARRDPTMSDDGAYVFFQSPVGLTPGALNDVFVGTGANGELQYAQNVYEWHAGHVYLISDGRDVSYDSGQNPFCESSSSVCLLGTDVSGADVFFSTADSLVAGDTDTEYDYYDARICTASEPCSQPVLPVPCQGEACHGTPAGAPGAVGAATATFSGPGNLVSSPAPVVRKKAPVKKRVKHKRRKRAKKRHAKGHGAARRGRGSRGGRS